MESRIEVLIKEEPLDEEIDISEQDKTAGMAHQHKLDYLKMKEEEITELMDSIPTDDESTSDEDNIDELDSDDEINAVENQINAMSYDDELAIDNNCLEEMANASTSAPTQVSAYKRFKRPRSPESTPTGGTFTGDVTTAKSNCTEFKSIAWKKENLQLHINELVFRGEKQLPTCLKELKTPYDCFRYFMNDQIFQHLTDQSNLYASQKNIRTKFVVTSTHLRQFVGILIYMSTYKYPNVRSYWGQNAFEPIRQTMPVLRFEEIRRYLHFNDNTAAIAKGNLGYDSLYKIRPLIDHFNNRFLSVPMLQRLCVDEQMCSTKIAHNREFKFFSLCDSAGFSYAFEIYSCAGDNKVLERTPDLESASNVVVRLSQQIPNFLNHILYFNHFYTSLGLLVYLRSRGIFSLGNVRTNRIPNCKLSSDATLTAKKAERGYSEEYVGEAFGIHISSVLWQDTKTLRFLSTYAGTKPFLSRNLEAQPRKAIRWDKKHKKHYEIDCPHIIKEYHHHMGGVDLMNRLIGGYHIKMKTQKWSNRIFYHLIDVSMVNAYLLYHRIHPENKVQLPNFRIQVSESLCLVGTVPPKSQVPLPKTPKRAYYPTEDVRFDQVGHWCIFQDRSGKKRCKYPKCTSETQAFCVKCKINVCNAPGKTCFFEFHNRSTN